jgi:hypothetical protein
MTTATIEGKELQDWKCSMFTIQFGVDISSLALMHDYSVVYKGHDGVTYHQTVKDFREENVRARLLHSSLVLHIVSIIKIFDEEWD